jgi:uronate dehydrogenase
MSTTISDGTMTIAFLWVTPRARFIGYRPKANAEQLAAKTRAKAAPMDPQNPSHMRHGGPFAGVELGHSGTAQMDIVDDKKKT